MDLIKEEFGMLFILKTNNYIKYKNCFNTFKKIKSVL
ncbi:hypothetical protein Flavo103_44080 [Flavobacterium collinsii]|nr:hypothetical protein Flavo103_44080 [Flavobacterium collinsii]